ncbi:MAG TPA: FecR family protein [Kofleriaceae bacterium]|nr:FecR family protein [Kofleriaceae bacterium]
MVMALALGALVGAACKKSNDTSAKDTPKTQESKTTSATEKATTQGGTQTDIGVQAGGIAHSDSEGAAAWLAAVSGTVEVRRVGETQWTAAKQDMKLYEGDMIRTADQGSATIAMADQSTVEMAETSSMAIASRDASADPASGAAMLGGMARFTVTPRAPGEGAFRVYTSSGVILTKGTTYGVGVSASGEARVGVESGTVDVIGLAQMDATPVAVSTTNQVVIAADGTVGAATAWPSDDWGTWRDETDAKMQLTAAMDAHGAAMTDLNKQLMEGYAQLQTNADAAATFEATAATAAEKQDTAAYTAALPEGSATIDASFSLAGRIEALTWAYCSHAELATELWMRHPKDVEASWTVMAPSVDAAVLWPKRWEVTATAYLEPLRMQYYVHHPRGRMHAKLVGVTVPEWYASVQAPAVDPATVRAKAKLAFWMTPDVKWQASSPRPVWITAPDASWHASVKATPATARGKVAWYVRPPTMKATALVGANVQSNWESKLKMQPAMPMADLHAMWKVPVGTKIKIAAPDMKAAANARASWKADAKWNADVAGQAQGKVHAPNVATDVKGKMEVKAPDVHVQVPDVNVKGKLDVAAGAGAKATADAKAGAKAAANAGADAAGKVDGAVKASVKAPEVKVKAPSVKVEGKAKGSFKLGN